MANVITKRNKLISSYKNDCPAIYMITNVPEDKIYIGSSSDWRARFEMHIFELNKSMHHNFRLQQDWYRLGEGAFKFELLYEFDTSISKNELLAAEQRYIDKYAPEYNIKLTVDLVKKDYVPYDVTQKKKEWLKEKRKVDKASPAYKNKAINHVRKSLVNRFKLKYKDGKYCRCHKWVSVNENSNVIKTDASEIPITEFKSQKILIAIAEYFGYEFKLEEWGHFELPNLDRVNQRISAEYKTLK